MQDGGFDVIIGNPPYVLYRKVRADYNVKAYQTEPCGNLYAFAVERSINLLRRKGCLAMIVPIASVSTEGMKRLQGLYGTFAQWHSHYAVRPGKLFSGVDMNLTVSMLVKEQPSKHDFVSGYRRWSSGAKSDRPYLFQTRCYISNPRMKTHANPYPKLGAELELQLLRRLHSHGVKLRDYVATGGTTLYYHSGGRYWRKALPFGLSSHYKPITVQKAVAPIVFAILNSQLFYWYWITNSNCMDVVAREVLEFPVFRFEKADAVAFRRLMRACLETYRRGSTSRKRRGERISVDEVNIDVSKAKRVIDEMDSLLGRNYGLNDEELDFIINYDIKYRMGLRAGGGE